MLGLVVPVFQRKFIRRCIASLAVTTGDMKLRVCIVNDGRDELRGWLEACDFPDFVEILHLERNRGFAGANNAGWRHLMAKYPDIRFLGSLNDDTELFDDCLQALVRGIEAHPTCGLAGSIQYVPRGWLGRPECLSLWRLGSATGQTMELIANVVRTDCQAAVLAGHCFAGRREVLQDVGLFDEEYINSCDDVDLSLAVRARGWDLYVIAGAGLTHFAGKSRYLKAASSKIHGAQPRLISKWGDNLAIYNDLAYFIRRRVGDEARPGEA